MALAAYKLGTIPGAGDDEGRSTAPGLVVAHPIYYHLIHHLLYLSFTVIFFL